MLGGINVNKYVIASVGKKEEENRPFPFPWHDLY